MPWIGGTFRLLYDFRADQAAGPPFSRITADRMMQQLEDIAATMAEAVRSDGSTVMNSDLDLDGNKVINAADATSPTDLVTLRQAAKNLRYASTFDQTTLGVNDISATNALAPSPIIAGYEFVGYLASTNSGAMTCSFNGGTRMNLSDRYGAALAPSDVRGNQFLRVMFTGTEFRIQGETMTAINGAVLGAIDNPNTFLYVDSGGEVSYETDANVRSILGLATVATSGSYNDLLNKPNITPIVSNPVVGDGSIGNPLDIDLELLTSPQLAQLVELLPVATSLTAGVVTPDQFRLLDGVDRLLRYYGRDFLIDPLTMPDGTSSVAYAYEPTITEGGDTPNVWSLAPNSDALPTGLSLDDETGDVTGTPTVPGVYNIILRLTDANSFYHDFASTVTIA